MIKAELKKCIWHKDKYECCYCNKKYENPVEFVENLNEDEIYKCPTCNSTFIKLEGKETFLVEPGKAVSRELKISKVLEYSKILSGITTIIGIIAIICCAKFLLPMIFVYMSFALFLGSILHFLIFAEMLESLLLDILYRPPYMI